MFLKWDSSLLIAAGASFIAGLLVTIIVKLWLKPLMGYNITKRRLDHELTRYLEQFGPAEESGKPIAPQKAREALKMARRYAMNLESRYSADIPVWYRLLLNSRKESPAEALGLLAPLAKIKDRKQIISRVDKARKAIGLS